MFQVNVGKKGVIFPKGHPYFMGQCQRCKSQLGTPNLSNPQCQACIFGIEQCKNFIEDCRAKAEEKQKRIIENKKEYERYRNDPDYEDVQFNPENGEVMAVHKEHKTHPNDTNAHIINGETLYAEDLEKKFRYVTFKKGHKVIFKKEEDHETDLDMYLDDVLMDLASITDNREDYRSALGHKNDQLKKYNHKRHITSNESVCLYFHDPTHFSYQKIVDGLNHIARYTRRVRIKKVYVMLNDDDTDLMLFEFP